MKPAARIISWWVGLAAALALPTPVHPALGAETTSANRRELQYEAPKHLRGTIYSLDRNHPKELFKFTREASRSGSTLTVRREFTYPDGRLAAREEVEYENDALLSYTLEEMQTGASGSAHLRRSPENPAKGSIEFAYSREPGARAGTHTEELAENTLTADMVGPFLTAHWAELARGDKVKCRYIVVPRKETVGFTFVKDSKSQGPARDVVIIRMEPSSRWAAALVKPLLFTLETALPHRVLQYTGRTTPKVRTDSKWKDLDALTVFDWNSAR